MDGLISEGRLLAIDEVLHEVERKDDSLHKWIKQRSQMFIDLDLALQRRGKEIITRFPSLAQSKSLMKGGADPFVIALAVERGLTVVSAEKSKPTKPRIPDVCNALGILHVTPLGLFRKEGWSFE